MNVNTLRHGAFLIAALGLAGCAARPIIVEECSPAVDSVVIADDDGFTIGDDEWTEPEVAWNTRVGAPSCAGELAPIAASEQAPLVVPTDGPGATLLEGVESFEVDGVEVILKRTPGKPVVSLGLYVRGGVHNLTDENAGIEELTLSMMTGGGSNALPRDAMFAELNTMGTVIASSTGRPYSTLAMQSVRKNWDASFDIFAGIALDPAFPDDELERQRTRSIEFLKSLEEDADLYISVMAQDLLFEGHPYARRHWGTIENFEGFDKAALSAYHDSIMVKDRLLVVAVGDIERADLEAKVKASFGTLPAGSWTEPAPLHFRACPGRLERFQADTPTAYVIAMFEAPAPTHPDYYPMVVALSVLRSRLFEKVRTKLELSYAVSAGMSDLPSNFGYLYASSSYPAHALAQIYDEVEALQDWQVNETDLANEVEVFITDTYMALETQGAQRNMLANAQLTRGDWRASAGFIDQVRTVTSADVRRVMQTWLGDALQVGFYGPPSLMPESVATSRPIYVDRATLEAMGLPSPGSRE